MTGGASPGTDSGLRPPKPLWGGIGGWLFSILCADAERGGEVIHNVAAGAQIFAGIGRALREAAQNQQSVYRAFALSVGQDAIGGTATLEEIGGSTVYAWQNLWKSTYQAVGKKLFSTSMKKQYKMFTIKGASETGVSMGMLPTETISLKVGLRDEMEGRLGCKIEIVEDGDSSYPCMIEYVTT